MDFNLYESLSETQELMAFLEANYLPSDSVRIVTDYTRKPNGKLAPKGYGTIYQVQDVLQKLERVSKIGEVIKGLHSEAGAWISVNPTTGADDESVTSYRHILVEADDIPLEKQKELLLLFPPVYTTIVDSGKRSLHALIPISNVVNKEEYKAMFDALYDGFRSKGFPMDKANGNPSRLTRLPGVQRGDGIQHLLFKNSLNTSLIYDSKEPVNPIFFGKTSKPSKTRSKASSKPKTRGSKTSQEMRDHCLEALEHIEPKELDYDSWYKISVAFKNEGGSYDEWLEWCQRDPERAIDLEKKWATLTTSNYKGRLLTHKYILNMARKCDPAFKLRILRNVTDPEEEEQEQFDLIEEGKFCIDILHAVRLDKKDLYIYTKEEGFTCQPEIIYSEIGSLYEDREQRPHIIKELYQYMQIYSPPIREADRKFIQFQNGILDTESKEFLPLTPDLFIRQRIPWNYNPKASSVDIVDRVLKDWFLEDEDSKALFLEWAGYQLLRYTPIAAFMLFIGPKRNGKSVACEWLRELVGYENSSSVAMKALEERFKTAVFHSKLSNIADENKGTYMPEINLLKAVSAGGYIDVEPKGQDSFSTRCTTKMTFAFNESFRVDDRCGALKERMNVLLFKADFSDRSKQDHSLLYKLTKPEAMDYFIKISIEALWSVLERGQFTSPKAAALWIEDQDLINNPHRAFFQEVETSQMVLTLQGEVLEAPDLWTKYPATMIYSAYKSWCLENDLEPWSQTIFGKEIQRELGLKRTQKWNKGPYYGKWFYKKKDS